MPSKSRTGPPAENVGRAGAGRGLAFNSFFFYFSLPDSVPGVFGMSTKSKDTSRFKKTRARQRWKWKKKKMKKKKRKKRYLKKRAKS
jgi:hypothetical protein